MLFASRGNGARTYLRKRLLFANLIIYATKHDKAENYLCNTDMQTTNMFDSNTNQNSSSTVQCNTNV